MWLPCGPHCPDSQHLCPVLLHPCLIVVGTQEVNPAGHAAFERFSQPLPILCLLPTCLPGMFWVWIREAKRVLECSVPG